MIKLFIFSLPFLAFSLFTFEGNDLLVSYITALLLLFYLFVRKNDAKIHFPKEFKFIIYFVIYISASLIYRYLSGQSINNTFYSQLMTIIIYSFFYLILINIFIMQKIKRISYYIHYFILICVILSIYTSLQAFVSPDSMLFHLFRNTNSSWRPILTLGGNYATWGNLNRVTGLGIEPMTWSAFLAIPLSILFPRLIFKFRIKDLFSFLFIFICFLLTCSRTGWIAFALAIIYLPIFILTGIKRKIFVSIMTIFVCISSVVFINYYINNMKIRTDWSLLERMAGTNSSWNMFIDNPLIGIGYGGFSLKRDEYSVNYGPGVTGSYSYNYYIRLLGETGIIGFCLWILFIRSLLIKLFSQYKYIKENNKIKVFYLGLCMALLSILFSWINVESINFMYMWFIFALIGVLPVVMKKSLSDQGELGISKTNINQ